MCLVLGQHADSERLRRAAEAVDKLELRGNDAASRLRPGGSAEDATAREAWGQLRTVRQLLQADAKCA